jgi:hypothetical protein
MQAFLLGVSVYFEKKITDNALNHDQAISAQTMVSGAFSKVK